MECRLGCGACCVAPSINGPIPGMPEGKPAGVRCVQLSAENRCMIFGRKERPLVCGQFRAEAWLCGAHRYQAMQNIELLERETLAVVE